MTPGDHVDTPYPDALILPQCDTERILATRLKELGGRVEQSFSTIPPGTKTGAPMASSPESVHGYQN